MIISLTGVAVAQVVAGAAAIGGLVGAAVTAIGTAPQSPLPKVKAEEEKVRGGSLIGRSNREGRYVSL